LDKPLQILAACLENVSVIFLIATICVSPPLPVRRRLSDGFFSNPGAKRKLRNDSKRLQEINFFAAQPRFVKGANATRFRPRFQNQARYSTQSMISGECSMAVPGHISTQQVPLLIGTGVLAGLDHF
jgi:hypothetical protein